MKLIKLTRECRFVDGFFSVGTLGELIPKEESGLFQSAASSNFPVSLDDLFPVMLNGKERLLMAEEFRILTN